MPKRSNPRILPIFLPHAGCPGRCVFCNQAIQSGIRPAAAHDALEKTLYFITTSLEERRNKALPPAEVAFYGGTFTALPDPWPERFLQCVAQFKKEHVVSAIRCSTRPDALPPARLDMLSRYGLETIELGVQTFHNAVLDAAGRNVSAQTARDACTRIKEAGFSLGIQLLPGLPGHTPAMLQHDIDETIALAPNLVRIYPCLVLRNTGLYALYKKGSFSPWTLEETIDAIRGVFPQLWRARIHVARIGLAETEELAKAVVSGPHHPALAAKCAGLALFDTIEPYMKRIAGQKKLFYPARLQGMLYGDRGECRQLYGQYNLQPATMHPWTHDHFALLSNEIYTH